MIWSERREREREASRKHKANLTPEKKDQIRSLQRERRSTPEYKAWVREYKRKQRATPDGKRKTRAELLRTKYGMTPEQWEQMFAAQGSCCAICKSTTPNSKKGWSTDHCHATNKVRGILCPLCNKALGLFKENLASMKAAIQYLTQ